MLSGCGTGVAISRSSPTLSGARKSPVFQLCFEGHLCDFSLLKQALATFLGVAKALLDPFLA